MFYVASGFFFGGRFGVVVTALVTSTNLSYRPTSSTVSTEIGDDLWQVYHPGLFRATQAHSAWPSSVDGCNEYWCWFRPPLGRNGEFCVAVCPATRTGGILAHCILT